MFNKYEIINKCGVDYLYLHIDSNYEFSKDFFDKKIKQRSKSFYENVKNYIINNGILFYGKKVFLVLNGIVIGSIMINGLSFNVQAKKPVTSNYQYVEYSKQLFDSNNIKLNKNYSVDLLEKEFLSETKDENKNEVTNSIQSSNKPSLNKVDQVAPTKPIPNSPATVPSPAPVAPAPNPVPTQPATIMVTVHRSSGVIENLSLEQYLIGVVGTEMPASFNVEALKAQAIISRTYALKRISENKILGDNTTTQTYKNVSELQSMWGNEFNKYYTKVEGAVNATKGQYVSYNGKYIDAVFHSTSNGKTEESSYVWGNAFPYLKSVESSWDFNASSYLRTTEITYETISNKLGIPVSFSSNIIFNSYTPSGRVNQIQIDGASFKGTKFRELLSLRSTDFSIEKKSNSIIFTTKGYGHGVGLSQYGAQGMANAGYSHIQILNHYYLNTVIKNL